MPRRGRLHHLVALRRPRCAFTLIELLVVIGIIAILMGILLPVIAMAMEQSRQTKCLANLHQIGLAVQGYANDHEGCLVPGDYISLSDPPVGTFVGAGSWAVILGEEHYLPVPEGYSGNTTIPTASANTAYTSDNVFRCPDATDQNIAVTGFPTSQTDLRGAGFAARKSDIGGANGVAVATWYAVNACQNQLLSGGRPLPMQFLPNQDPVTKKPDYRVSKITQFTNVSALPIIFDGAWSMGFLGASTAYDPARINARHGNGRSTNVLYMDGHCTNEPTNTLPTNDWYLQ